jgi:hypothetical protein
MPPVTSDLVLRLHDGFLKVLDEPPTGGRHPFEMPPGEFQVA